MPIIRPTIGQNPIAGTVAYQYEYNNRPSNITPGALSEVITVENDRAADVFAQIPVLGRPLGPVLQAIGTVTVKKRISIEIQMPAATTNLSVGAPNTTNIVEALMPSPAFVESDRESWVANTGRYSRTTSFVYE